jgi:hypothetical protein
MQHPFFYPTRQPTVNLEDKDIIIQHFLGLIPSWGGFILKHAESMSADCENNWRIKIL